jgi:DNA-directed RNA polymerase subunit RPC12/RpoP
MEGTRHSVIGADDVSIGLLTAGTGPARLLVARVVRTRAVLLAVGPNEMLQALLDLKDVQAVHYRRSGPNVEMMIEQVLGVVRCPSCAGRTQVKERPVVHYVDLPVYGVPVRLA